MIHCHVLGRMVPLPLSQHGQLAWCRTMELVLMQTRQTHPHGAVQGNHKVLACFQESLQGALCKVPFCVPLSIWPSAESLWFSKFKKNLHCWSFVTLQGLYFSFYRRAMHASTSVHSLSSQLRSFILLDRLGLCLGCSSFSWRLLVFFSSSSLYSSLYMRATCIRFY